MLEIATAFNTPPTPFIFSCKRSAVLILLLLVLLLLVMLLLELSLISCRRRRRQCVAVCEQSRYHLYRSCFCRSGGSILTGDANADADVDVEAEANVDVCN